MSNRISTSPILFSRAVGGLACFRAATLLIVAGLLLYPVHLAAVEWDTSREDLCRALPKGPTCTPIKKPICGEPPPDTVKSQSDGVTVILKTGEKKFFRNTKGSDIDSRYLYRGFCAHKHFWLWSARWEGGLNEFVSYETGDVIALWGTAYFSPSGERIAQVYWANYGAPPAGLAIYQFGAKSLSKVQSVLFPAGDEFPGSIWPLWTSDTEIVLFDVIIESDSRLKPRVIVGRIKYDNGQWILQR